MSATTVQRVRSVSTAELRLFGRNRTALFSALAMPLVLAGAISGTDLSEGPLSANAFLITSLLGFVLLAAVYYNLVTTFVARREDLVLKRLRAGELTDGEILTGIASPMIVVAVGQILLFVLAGAVLLGLPVPVNIPVLLLGALGGVAVFVLLAAVSAGYTKTTETAQITTLPVLLACMIGSGLMVPIDGLPATVTSVLRALPLSPVIDLMRLGWLGSTGAGRPEDFAGVLTAAPLPAAILVAWIVFGAVTVRRRFRWEPRD